MILVASISGPPMTQGSKVAGLTRDGRPFLREARGTAVRAWRETLARDMLRALAASGALSPLGVNQEDKRASSDAYDGAWFVSIVVRILRPPSHFTARGKLRRSAPDRPTSRRSDLDKVARAVLDAGTGLWWRDDGQVVGLAAAKQFLGSPEDAATVLPAELSPGPQVVVLGVPLPPDQKVLVDFATAARLISKRAAGDLG